MIQHHPRRSSLPHGNEASLIGRVTESDTLTRWLLADRVRLVAITGIGGVGKTRLTLQALETIADRFRDGVAIVPLAAVNDHRLVPLAVARAIELTLSGDAPPEQEIIAWIGDRELALLVDTFEHLLPAGRLLAQLLTACPRLQIIVTSRVTPGIPGETVLRIAPLVTPPVNLQVPDAERARWYDAVALFETRARAANSDFALNDDNASIVTEICRRLDGLPLAIELAAARARALPPQLMLRQIERRRELPYSAARDAPLRHRSMHDAIAWSYDLLPPAEQRLFRVLALFHGSFTLDDAAAVLSILDRCPPNRNMLQQRSAALTSASLLSEEQPSGAEATYVMLSLLREYGRRELALLGEEELSWHAHARWVLSRVAAPEPSCAARIARVDALRDEIRAALDWSIEHAEAQIAEPLLAAIGPAWIGRGFYRELREWLERALAIQAPPPATPVIPLALAQVTARQGDLAVSLTYAELAFERASQGNDRSALADAALTVAVAAGRLGKHDRSRAMGELALASLREIADANRIAAARAQLAHLAILRRELAPAQSMAELALEQNQIIDESSGAIEALDLLSLIARLRGDTVRQSQLARQMLELTQRVSDPFAIASGLWTAAAIAAERGCFAEAARFYGAQEAVRLANGFAIDPGYSSDHAASVAAVRAALDARTFTDLWAEGRALVPAVALAAATSFLAEVADREQAAYQAEKRALQSLGLSDRQQDVLRLIGQGRSDREIADILSISARTVSKHVEAILMRLDAHTRSGATAIAARLAADARKRTPSTEHGSVR